jgi:hypothetical protein
LPTVEAFKPWLVEVHKAKGKFNKGSMLGSYELEYEYEDDSFLLASGIYVEPSVREAKSTAHLYILGAKLGLAGEVGRKNCPASANELGDQVHCSILVSDDVTLGHFLVVRRGKRVFMMLVSGLMELSFEDLIKLVRPYLDGMEEYSP